MALRDPTGFEFFRRPPRQARPGFARSTFRVVAIGAAAYACAFLSGLASLAAMVWSMELAEAIPPGSARDLSGPLLWNNVLWAVLVMGTAGFLVCVGWLWHTSLLRSIPIVFGVCVAIAFGTGPLGNFSPLLTLFAGVFATLFCRDRALYGADRAWSANTRWGIERVELP